MKRNTILYILIALLVVVGGAWYALSARTVDEGTENDRTEETQEGSSEDNEGSDTDNGAEGSTAANGEGGQTGSTQGGTTSGTSAENTGVNTQGTNSQGVTNESTGSDSEYGVGGTEISTKELVRVELNAQLVVLESIVQIISLQLENGDLTDKEAGELLDQVGGALDELEKTVELFLAL